MADQDVARPSSDALDAWVLATLPRAVAYAASLLRDRHAADDVVHDCYCRLLQKAEVYDLLRDGTKLLFKAITNACIDRTTRQRPTSSLEAGASANGTTTLLDPRAEDPLDIVLQRELADHIAAALDRLPVAQRAALELKSLGHSLQEIADALEVSASNAGVLVHRARQTVAEFLTAIRGDATA